MSLESKKPKQQVERQKKGFNEWGFNVVQSELREINLVTKGTKEMGINLIPSYIGVSFIIQWIIRFMTTHIKRLPM